MLLEEESGEEEPATGVSNVAEPGVLKSEPPRRVQTLLNVHEPHAHFTETSTDGEYSPAVKRPTEKHHEPSYE